MSPRELFQAGKLNEAVQALSRFAFENLEAKRVEIRCDAGNARSRAVPERLGFKQEALLRNHCRDGAGELRDTLIFALTPDDYEQAKVRWVTRQP